METGLISWVGLAAISILAPSAAILGFFLGRKSMRRSLTSHLGELSDLSSDISGSAEQVASVSQDIAAASQEQIDTLTGTVSASHEIRSMIEKTTESSGLLQSEAALLRKLVQSGNQVVEEMVSSSQSIKTGMDHFNREMQESMQQLSSAMGVIQEIATKTQVINDIVFQTKLLSFNASVEAARAGEAGKGFSVVAEEVGKLAQMSGAAANEIASIVERSVSVVRSSISTTRSKIESLTLETTQKSEIGLSKSKSCENIFAQMAEKISETTNRIEQISSATAEQSLGVVQLDQSILKFQEAADRNRLIASQATEHSKEFETQTKGLSKVVADCSAFINGQADLRRHLKPFVWTSKLVLGVKKMDDEHLILVEKINALVIALDENSLVPNKKKLILVFEELAQYTTEHFADEEQFMESIGYPQLSSHKRIHQNLLEQVGVFGRKLDSDTLDDGKLVSFLRNWLLSHIMGVDLQYAGYYKGQSKHSSSFVKAA